MKIIVCLLFLASWSVFADTPPPSSILKLKGGPAEGAITAHSGAVTAVAPGALNNVLTSNGFGVWVSSGSTGGGGGGGITQLTGDVVAGPGTGSVPASVAFVGGISAASTASMYPKVFSGTANALSYFNTIGTLSSLGEWLRASSGGLTSTMTFTAPVDAGDVFYRAIEVSNEVVLPQSTVQFHPSQFYFETSVDTAQSNFNLSDVYGGTLLKHLRGNGVVNYVEGLRIIDDFGSGTNTGSTLSTNGLFQQMNINTGYLVNDITAGVHEIYNYSYVSNAQTLLYLHSAGTGVANGANGLNIDYQSAVENNLNLINVFFNNTVSGSLSALNIYDGGTSLSNSTLINNTFGGVASGGMSMANFYSNGTSNGDFKYLNAGSNGTVNGYSGGVTIFDNATITGGLTGFGYYQNLGNVGSGPNNNATAFEGSFQNALVNGNVQGVNLFVNSTVSGSITGVNIGTSSQALNGINGFNFNNQAITSGASNYVNGLNLFNSAYGYRYTGAAIANSASMAEEFRGVSINNSGTNRTAVGLDVYMSGQTTDDARAIRTNVATASSSTQGKVMNIEATGGLFSFYGSYSLQSNQTVDVGHIFAGLFSSDSVISNSDQILMLFQPNLQVHEDINLGPLGLGTNMIGAVPQVAVDSGKTVPFMRALFLGASVPSGSGGTITEFVTLDILGLPSFGGSVTNPTRTAIRDAQFFGQNFCDGATTCHFINVRDGNAQNSFAGGVQLTTSGTQPTCDAAHRGTLWNVEGGAGVADVLQVCQKDAADNYVWNNL